MNFGEIEQLEEMFQVETYAKMNIALERGSGVWVTTNDGIRYLDLYGGHAVCATGHSHPHIVKAINTQLERIMFYSNIVYSEVRARAAEKLVSVSPSSIEKVFFCNSGTEANENAMRMARFKTGREKIVSFSGGFHGRTADAISATFLATYREIGKPNVPAHFEAEFGDIETLAKVIDKNTAGVIIEPIQSMAGVREADPEFFIALRELCNRVGAVLIFDEVQTGIGRTGEWFYSASNFAGGVHADIITVAKSLGSGVPVGACLVNDEVAASTKLNALGTTFGGGMIAMAAVLATLEAIESENMIANAKAVEVFLREKIGHKKSVRAVRGKGCLLGIEFHPEVALAKDVHANLLDKRIITGTSGDPNILRLLPPLCVSTENIQNFLVNIE
ncbi:MAG: aspartate aminotransferase family protein [Pyrinomonadaceae bacterium]